MQLFETRFSSSHCLKVILNFILIRFLFHTGCGKCPEGFTYFKRRNKCYKAFSTKQTWDDALNNCSHLNSHLVTIQSPFIKRALNAIIHPFRGNSFLAILMGICLRNNLSKLNSFAPRKLQSSFWGPCENRAVFKPSFWTAGRRKCPNGPFYWVPNRGILVEMMYTNWNPGEPNNLAGNEDCVHFLGADSESFTWNDTPCGSKNCFVCEVDMWNK